MPDGRDRPDKTGAEMIDKHFRLPKSLLARVMNQAADDGRTVTHQVIKILGDATGWDWGVDEPYGPLRYQVPQHRNRYNRNPD